MKIEHNKLMKAKLNYFSAIGNMEVAIADKVLFEFGIEDLPGDGFCVCDVEQSNLAPLSKCLAFIKVHGKLSQDDHESMSI